MHNMSPSEIQELKTKLAVIEALVEEKWKSHDESSKKHWDNIEQFHVDMRTQMASMSNRLNDLPCESREAVTAIDRENYAKDNSKIWDAIKGIIAIITAIGVSMIYSFVSHLTGGK